MEKAEIIGKRIECIIGIIMLVPVFLGIIAFIFNVFNVEEGFVSIDTLSHEWTACYFNGGGMSAAPIYLALMAMVGAYLIKDSVKYFFMKSK
jgi:hypothetical protein